MICLHRIRIAIAIVLTSAGLLLFTGWSKPAAAETIDAKLKEVINPPVGSKVTIAPMTDPGHLPAGTATPVDAAKIFSGIFKRVGIAPCDTDPKNLQKATGYLDFIEFSEVLNTNGTRATFGFFIRVAEGLEAESKS